jgi:hypothetical protein
MSWTTREGVTTFGTPNNDGDLKMEYINMKANLE